MCHFNIFLFICNWRVPDDWDHGDEDCYFYPDPLLLSISWLSDVSDTLVCLIADLSGTLLTCRIWQAWQLARARQLRACSPTPSNQRLPRGHFRFSRICPNRYTLGHRSVVQTALCLIVAHFFDDEIYDLAWNLWPGSKTWRVQKKKSD